MIPHPTNPTTSSGELGSGRLPLRMPVSCMRFLKRYRNSALQNTIYENGTLFRAVQYVKNALPIFERDQEKYLYCIAEHSSAFLPATCC
jgi:hypothetical protein